MISYEFFVMYASVIALKTGSNNLTQGHERTIHAACIAVGLLAFVAFYVLANVTYQDFRKTSNYGYGNLDTSLTRLPFLAHFSLTSQPGATLDVSCGMISFVAMPNGC